MNIFRHSGSNGDIIYALPAIISMGGGKLNICKRPHYDLLKSLLSLQPNLEVAYGTEGIDLDKFREINDNKKHLAQCHLEALQTKFDLKQPWLFNIEPIGIAPIVVNRTRHYHDKNLRNDVRWETLQDYASKILFIGLEDEFEVFKKRFVPKATRYRHCSNALEMANIINGSKLFIGNQSLAFALAEAMKHKRVLEVCHTYNNCRPSGANSHTELTIEIIDKCLSM